MFLQKIDLSRFKTQLPLQGANDWCVGKGMALVTLETVKELDSILALIGLNTGLMPNYNDWVSVYNTIDLL
jgi:hypothetical protein